MVSQLSLVAPSIADLLRHIISSRVTVLLVWGVVALILWRPVWSRLWRMPLLGMALSKAVFPDLAGKWEIEIRSNWPIIDFQRQAAADANHTRFDVLADGTTIPSLLTSTFDVNIKQEWSGVQIEFEPTTDSVLENSRTLSVELLPSNETYRKRIAWTYLQKNKQPRLPTDEQEFFGSALLELSDDANEMSGKYWTNRSWDRGLNAAGLITARRVV
ncbi:MAG: hypothetical protein AAF234_19895 [Pseudomonadota bacterium]